MEISIWASNDECLIWGSKLRGPSNTMKRKEVVLHVFPKLRFVGGMKPVYILRLWMGVLMAGNQSDSISITVSGKSTRCLKCWWYWGSLLGIHDSHTAFWRIRPYPRWNQSKMIYYWWNRVHCFQGCPSRKFCVEVWEKYQNKLLKTLVGISQPVKTNAAVHPYIWALLSSPHLIVVHWLYKDHWQNGVGLRKKIAIGCDELLKIYKHCHEFTFVNPSQVKLHGSLKTFLLYPNLYGFGKYWFWLLQPLFRMNHEKREIMRNIYRISFYSSGIFYVKI